MFALVTGGGGFLGRYIVEQLLARGDRVRSFSRGVYPELTAQGVEVVQGDIQDSEAVQLACQGVDTVFHVAALPGIWGKWETYYSINTLGTNLILEGCRRNGVKRLIYTSSPSVVPCCAADARRRDLAYTAALTAALTLQPARLTLWKYVDSVIALEAMAVNKRAANQ